MSHRHKAPVLKVVGGKEFKATRRIVKKLAAMRLAYGKSTFFDTDTHEALYPIEVICDGLYRAVVKAGRANEQIELSVDEFKLWQEMFPPRSNRSKPSL